MILLVFLAGSLASLYATLRFGSTSLRLPVAVYLGAYLVTTVIGATIVGVQHGGQMWALYGGGLDTSVIRDYDSFFYWGMLYSPLVLVPLTCLLTDKLKPRGVRIRGLRNLLRMDIPLAGYWLILGVFIAYCVAMLDRARLLAADALVHTEGDYLAMLQLRQMATEGLGRMFFGLLYMGIPALAQVSCYQAVRKRAWSWRVSFLATIVTVCVLNLFTAQKAPIFVFVLSIGIGWARLTRRSLWGLAAGGALSFVLLNSIQTFLLRSWGALQSLYLIIFRMADSFPYYLNLYPGILPYTGIDVALDLIGLASRPTRPADVISYMYPMKVTLYLRAAPAPAHVDAYAQAGVAYSLLILVVCGLMLKTVAVLGRSESGPVRHALFVQGLVSAYYLSQVSIRDVLITSYGIAWSLVAVAALIAGSSLLYGVARGLATARGELVFDQ